MQVEIIVLSKSEREGQIPYDITYMWNLSCDTNESANRTDSRTENQLVAAQGKGTGEGMVWEAGVSRCELLHIERISNKVLLHSTENYIQYPTISHNGKCSLKKTKHIGISLVVQWLRICHVMQGMWVRSLVGGKESHMPRSS